MEILTILLSACLGSVLAQSTCTTENCCAKRFEEASGTVYRQQCEYLKSIEPHGHYLNCLNDNDWLIYEARDYCADHFYNQTFKETKLMLFNACSNGDEDSVKYICCLMTWGDYNKEQEQKEENIKKSLSGCDKVDISRKCIMQVLRNDSNPLFYS